MPLFRVEARHGDRNGLLGYQWIEVLAIEPWALAERTRDFGDWCDRKIACHYVCLTESGLMRIGSDDFWTAIEEYREYDELTPQPDGPQIVITTGDSSVVQTGGHIAGDVSTSHSRTELDLIPMQTLAAELAELRVRLAAGAQNVGDYRVIGAIAEAEEAATREDRGKVVHALRNAGRAALQGARDIGVEVAASAIAKSIGAG